MRIKMDAKSKILIGLFILFVIAAGVWKYHSFFVERDFVIYTWVSCDTTTESCFAMECEEGDEECDDWAYKKMEIPASETPYCDPYVDEECPEPVCEVGSDCIEILCSEETLEEGEMCLAIEPEEEESGTENEETQDNEAIEETEE